MLRLVFLLVLITFRIPAHADDDALRSAIQARFPYQKIVGLHPAALPGFYEVDFSDHIVYIDHDLHYLITGDIYELNGMHNLTETRRRQLHDTVFDQLPFNLAIKRIKGNGQAKLAVFTDPQCPYCRRMEQTLTGMNNVTIYTFMLPLLPGSEALTRAIWCQPNRTQAWENQLLRGRAPTKNQPCDTADLSRITALARQLGISVTPTLIFSNGDIHPGALDADSLHRLLNDTLP